MDTTIKELQNNIREQEKYYFKKKNTTIYNEQNHYFYILSEWKSYLYNNNYCSSDIVRKFVSKNLT